MGYSFWFWHDYLVSKWPARGEKNACDIMCEWIMKCKLHLLSLTLHQWWKKYSIFRSIHKRIVKAIKILLKKYKGIHFQKPFISNKVSAGIDKSNLKLFKAFLRPPKKWKLRPTCSLFVLQYCLLSWELISRCDFIIYL